MIEKSIELSPNNMEVKITDIKNFSGNMELENTKYIIYLNDINLFNEIYHFINKFPEQTHLKFCVSSQLMMNIDKNFLVGNFIIKNIEEVDYYFYIDCFTSMNINKNVIDNNQKIIDKIHLIRNKLNSLAKTQELAYKANQILEELKEKEENLKTLKQKLHYVNSIANKM